MGVFDQGPSKERASGSSSKGSVLDMLGLGSPKGRSNAAPQAFADGGEVDDAGPGSDEGSDPEFAPSAEQKMAAQDVMAAMKTGDAGKFLRSLKGLLYMLDDAGGDEGGEEKPAPMPQKRTSIFDR